MRRQVLPFAVGLLLGAAVLAFEPAMAAEQPGPGLEIFDVDGTDTFPGPGVQYPPDQSGSAPYVPSTPAPTQPVYTPAPVQTYDSQPFDSQPYAGDPFAQQPYDGTPMDPGTQTYTDPYAAPVAGDTFYPGDTTYPGDTSFETEPLAGEGGDLGAGDDNAAAGDIDATESYVPQLSPRDATLASLNRNNPHFPGLAGAADSGDLRGAGDIIWQVLKERRIVQTTMSRGPRGSAGMASSFEFQMVFEAINYSPATDTLGADSPSRAAQRINMILDAFESPLVEDYGFGSNMEMVLVRLNQDITAVRDAMAEVTDEGVFQELARTYIRAATTCDFFIFPRNELIADITAIMRRSAPLFYPDGASIGGDVAGVTGNLFQDLLMLDFYSRDDSRFRRGIGAVWSTLEKPSRYLIDVSMPDRSLPRFGPRGSRELTPMDVARLQEMFPRSDFRVNRIGLAASHSFPEASNQKSYGGIFVSRSGPEPDARYMAMRFGPLGNLCEVPPHYDFGSMSLMSRNIKFIVDPGGYGGEAAAAWAHSTLSLDNETVLGTSYNEQGQPVDTIWRTNASLDYATDQAAFPDGKTWQRTMVYVKNLPGEARADYWVVLDHVDMKNDNQPRQARIRYQLAPGIQAYHDGSGVLATASYVDGSALRIFAVDANAKLEVTEGAYGVTPSQVFDASGGTYAAPSVNLTRTLVGNTTTATVIYPGENMNHRPARIERDADIIRGRTGALVIDHGMGRIDVIAWAPPGTELVTPTLNLQMAADLGVFRIRDGKFVRINFVNLERFQAKEPDGGIWSMRVSGAAQTLTLEPEKDGGWQVLSDPANAGSATLYEVNLGPAIAKRKFGIRPGNMRIVVR